MYKAKIYVQDTLINEVMCVADSPDEAAAGSFYRFGWDWRFHSVASVIVEDNKKDNYRFSMRNFSYLDAVNASLNCKFV